MPTIRCSTCSEWHHRLCVNIFENEDRSFVCHRCSGLSSRSDPFYGEFFLPRKPFSFRFDNASSNYILDAGLAHGIAIGAEFTAYSNTDELLEHPLMIFIVEKVSNFSSVMRTTSSSLLNYHGSALQTKSGRVEHFRLHIPAEDPFRALCESIRASTSANLQNVFLVSGLEEAHLKICTMPSGDIHFVHTDERVTRHATNLVTDGMKPHPPRMVWGILERAARYFLELNRTSVSQGIEDYIDVEFYKLDPPRIRLPERSTLELLAPVGPNLCHDNIIDFVVEDSAKPAPYGFKIVNRSEQDLYVNAFYFDNTNFQIVPYCVAWFPSGERKREPLLKGQGELTIGYGSEEWRPFVYEVPNERDLDLGFLKIYLSTQAVDFSGVQQRPALFGIWKSPIWRPQMQSLLGTVLIPIIQRRRQNSS